MTHFKIPDMPEVGALYRCVCGTDVPLKDGDTVACPRCGRRQRFPIEQGHGAAETVLLSATRSSLQADTPTVASAGQATVNGVKQQRPNLVGRVLDHFEVLEELGRGGMGTVYRALDRSLERYVALKVLDSEEARNQEDLVEAFVHEARTQARMNHPGITTIYYIGKFEEMTYFAMEIVAGSNLESRIKNGPMPFREVIEAGLQVVHALKEAQFRGVIHRDVKPGNIILSNSGRVKVTDFGLSKTEKGGLQITGSRHITGTPYYISPEQARGETTDFRSDIYSLGATLYHLAYGKPPFDGDNFMAVIAKHLSEPVVFPAHPPNGVPPGFPYVLERMLAKKPDDRFPSYEELEEALLDLRPEALVIAALGRRAVASSIDHAAVLIGGLLLSALVSFSTKWFGGGEPPPPFTMGAMLAALVTQQVLTASTLGKLFGKLRIVRIDGRQLSRPRLLARGLLQYLNPLGICLFSAAELLGATWGHQGMITFGIGTLSISLTDSLWALTNKNRRTLHDLLLKTWVLERV